MLWPSWHVYFLCSGPRPGSTKENKSGSFFANYKHHSGWSCRKKIHSIIGTTDIYNSVPDYVFGTSWKVDQFLRGYSTSKPPIQYKGPASLKNQTLHEWTKGLGQNCDEGELCLQCPPTIAHWGYFSNIGWQQRLWVSYPCLWVWPFTVISLQLKSCLSCVCFLLGSALRPTGVMKHVNRCYWVKMTLNFSVRSTWTSCIILMIPVTRTDNISHKGGSNKPLFLISDVILKSKWLVLN